VRIGQDWQDGHFLHSPLVDSRRDVRYMLRSPEYVFLNGSCSAPREVSYNYHPGMLHMTEHEGLGQTSNLEIHHIIASAELALLSPLLVDAT
jgi:hypothetical protein